MALDRLSSVSKQIRTDKPRTPIFAVLKICSTTLSIIQRRSVWYKGRFEFYETTGHVGYLLCPCLKPHSTVADNSEESFDNVYGQHTSVDDVCDPNVSAGLRSVSIRFSRKPPNSKRDGIRTKRLLILDSIPTRRDAIYTIRCDPIDKDLPLDTKNPVDRIDISHQRHIKDTEDPQPRSDRILPETPKNLRLGRPDRQDIPTKNRRSSRPNRQNTRTTQKLRTEDPADPIDRILL